MLTFTTQKTISKRSRQTYTGDKSAYVDTPAPVVPYLIASGFGDVNTNGNYLYGGLFSGVGWYKKGTDRYIMYEGVGNYEIVDNTVDPPALNYTKYYAKTSGGGSDPTGAYTLTTFALPTGIVAWNVPIVATLDTCYLRPMGEEDSAMNGVQFGLGFSIIVECDVDILEGDKLTIEGVEYTIRGVVNHDRGSATRYKRALALKAEKQ